MPTAVSSHDHLTDARRAVTDVAHLLRFRATRGFPRWLLVVLPVITVVVAVAPALVDGAGARDGAAFEALVFLPSAFLLFAGLNLASAAVSGGGRELLAREQSVAFPVSPTTDHLGALLLAPLNTAYLIQAWSLLGLAAFGAGPERLPAALAVTVTWILCCTAGAQAVAWSVETVRRSAHGQITLRGLAVVIGAGILSLHLLDRLVPILDRAPTVDLVITVSSGSVARVVLTSLVLVLATVALAWLGAWPARTASRSLPRDELRVETGNATPRPMARTMLGALIRTDRVSVWRAVPMRRGLVVLALGPGLVAVLGDLDWETMTILPGLVASGGALLYGVNAWCLDGRGILWRESLPVPPSAVFDSRAYVLAEFLTVGSLATVLLGFVRAGVPGVGEFAALIGAVLVVTVQVVAAAMRWSLARPFAVDMRSARATPAPPAVMVGYSARLAVSTTFVGVFFSLLSRLEDPTVTIVVALLMIAWSGGRLLLTRRDWIDPHRRVRVTTTVVGA